MEKNPEIIHTYPNLYELDGSILDEESYQKHVQSKKSATAAASSASGSFSASGSSSGSGFLGGYGLHLIAP